MSTPDLLAFIAAIQQAPGGAGRGGLVLMIYTVAFIAIMWFIILGPQRRTQKKHQQMVAELKKGDEVMTEGGILGSVIHLTEDRLTIKTAENTRVVVARSKIARVFSTEPEAKS
ncbi:MAG: preprotein translocase subunit YajC [Gemmatimonadetes bacterium]|nr:preprotein translocase subunit YajC [Gemmatimonadota bacterium]